jgi:hypothetical protein
MAQKTPILQEQGDWTRFYKLIRDTAENKEVWDYINPETADDQLPKYVKPHALLSLAQLGSVSPHARLSDGRPISGMQAC